MNAPLILTIETSCDETSVAVTKGRVVVSNVIHSQLDLHAKYGGVVPSIARLAHQEKIDDVLEAALQKANVTLADIEIVAVTQGPGLAIALEVGINKAKEIAAKYKLPLVPVNHMEGHLLSSFAILPEQEETTPEFPVLGVLVSGKHSEFVMVNGVGQYEKIGYTLDDACGEAFDKAAVMLGLGYPGGPKISQLAAKSDLKLSLQRENKGLYAVAENSALRMPIPMATSGDYNLSYSGLKTALKQLVNELSDSTDHQNIRETGENESLKDMQKQDLAKIFEYAAIEMLLYKLQRALKDNKDLRQIWFGGGVIANQYLRERAIQIGHQEDIEVVIPTRELTGDNAAMIGVAAGMRILAGIDDSVANHSKLDREPNKSL